MALGAFQQDIEPEYDSLDGLRSLIPDDNDDHYILTANDIKRDIEYRGYIHTVDPDVIYGETQHLVRTMEKILGVPYDESIYFAPEKVAKDETWEHLALLERMGGKEALAALNTTDIPDTNVQMDVEEGNVGGELEVKEEEVKKKKEQFSHIPFLVDRRKIPLTIEDEINLLKKRGVADESVAPAFVRQITAFINDIIERTPILRNMVSRFNVDDAQKREICSLIALEVAPQDKNFDWKEFYTSVNTRKFILTRLKEHLPKDNADDYAVEA